MNGECPTRDTAVGPCFERIEPRILLSGGPTMPTTAELMDFMEGAYHYGWIGAGAASGSPGTDSGTLTMEDDAVTCQYTTQGGTDSWHMVVTNAYYDAEGWLVVEGLRDGQPDTVVLAASDNVAIHVNRTPDDGNMLGMSISLRRPDPGSITRSDIPGNNSFFGHWLDWSSRGASAGYGSSKINRDGTAQFTWREQDGLTRKGTAPWTLNEDDCTITAVVQETGEVVVIDVGHDMATRFDIDQGTGDDIGYNFHVERGRSPTPSQIAGHYLLQGFLTDENDGRPLTLWGTVDFWPDRTFTAEVEYSDRPGETISGTYRIGANGTVRYWSESESGEGIISRDRDLIFVPRIGLDDPDESSIGGVYLVRSSSPQYTTPDLAAQLGDVSLPDVAVPGDKGKVTVIVVNEGFAPAKVNVSIEIYASADGALDAGDLLLDETPRSLSLAPGGITKCTVQTSLPSGLSPGDYHLLVKVVTTGTFVELTDDNNLAVSDDADDVVWRFGSFAGRRNVKLTLADALGTPVTFSLRGSGFGEVTAVGPDGFDVVFTGTDGRSAATMTTPRGTETALHNVTAHGPLGRLTGKTVDLTGDLIVDGWMGALRLDDVGGGHSIDIGHLVDAADVTARDKVTLALDEVADTSLQTHWLPIGSLTVTEWLDIDGTPDEIAAPWIGKLKTTGRKPNVQKGISGSDGDFGADLDLDGAGKTGRSLGSATIAGGLSGAEWTLLEDAGPVKIKGVVASSGVRSGGTVGLFQAGAMVDSALLAGTRDGVTGLPVPTLDFEAAEAAIDRVRITGVAGVEHSFRNSHVAAPSLGRVTLCDACFDNAGVPFGLSAWTLGKLTYTDDDTRYVWPQPKALFAGPPELWGDLKVWMPTAQPGQTTAPPTSEGLALQHLSETMDKYHATTDVYTDAAAAGNHFTLVTQFASPGGADKALMDTACETEALGGRTSIECSFLSERLNWGGWQFVNGVLPAGEAGPRMNWGSFPGAGLDLSGAKSLSFWAKGAKGGERVELFAFGIGRDPATGRPHEPYPDSCRKTSLGYVTLGKQWKRYRLNLRGKKLGYVIGGLGWVTNAPKNGRRDITFYLDEIRFDKPRLDEPRFLVSYETIPSDNVFDRMFVNTAFTYDNALGLLAYVARGTADDLRRAGLLADAFVYALDHDRHYEDGRLRDGYQGGDLPAPPGWAPNGREGAVRLSGWWDKDAGTWPELALGSGTGNAAWAILALVDYCEKAFGGAGGEVYLDAAKRLGEWIATGTPSNPTPAGGYTGGYAGPEWASTPHLWKSTEHNLDCYAAFGRLYQATGDDVWLGRAQYARQLVEAMWSEEDGRFYTGTGTDGQTPNVGAEGGERPADVNAWAALALGDPRGLGWVETSCAVEADGFRGFDFNDDRDHVWFEGTAHMALAYQADSRPDDAQTVLDELRRAQFAAPNSNGMGIVAASADGLTTGFGSEYYARLHVGATAWYVLAERAYNPYWGIPTTDPVPSY